MYHIFAHEQKESVSSEKKNPRGRPRLTEEEKQRRKELRELGLMKRSKRRTKEGVCVCVGGWVGECVCVCVGGWVGGCVCAWVFVWALV